MPHSERNGALGTARPTLVKYFSRTTVRRRSKLRSSSRMNSRAAARSKPTSRNQNFFRSRARITATRWVRSHSATLICSTRSYSGLLFKTDKVMSPYCYRCPFNRAKPERADAREYRKCNWECVGKVEQKFLAQKKKGNPYAAFVFEPLIQGAAGMIPQPAGWLKRVTQIARGHGALLIADEVMTGFGRTGEVAQASSLRARHPCSQTGSTMPPNSQARRLQLHCSPRSTKAFSRIFSAWPRG